MSNLTNNEKVTEREENLTKEIYDKEFLPSSILDEEVEQKWSIQLQEFQRLRSELNDARQEIVNLDQRLYHARRNLEVEKRKRRAVEKQKDLLENQINMTREILFNNEEVNLDARLKKKLQFLDKPIKNNKCNNLYIRNIQNDGRLNMATVQLDSTGSILSDLNCLSKSEDELDINNILIMQKQGEWRKHRPSCEYSVNKQRNTLDKVAEFNLLGKITVATAVNSNNNTQATSLQLQNESEDKNINSEASNEKVLVRHSFVSKIIIKPEICTICGKRIRFGKVMLKCKDCPIMCHTECKTLVFQSCVRSKAMTLYDFPKK